MALTHVSTASNFFKKLLFKNPLAFSFSPGKRLVPGWLYLHAETSHEALLLIIFLIQILGKELMGPQKRQRIENEDAKVLWDFRIPIDKHLPQDIPD